MSFLEIDFMKYISYCIVFKRPTFLYCFICFAQTIYMHFFRLQRLKVCTYWLPPTLKLVPHSYSALLQCLEDKISEENLLEQQDRFLFGWVAVSRVVREHLHVSCHFCRPGFNPFNKVRYNLSFPMWLLLTLKKILIL